MTNTDAIKWLENLKKDIGEPTHQSLWHYEQAITEIIGLLADHKTEPTISKMEQVEDETRLTAKCLNCANGSSYKCSKCDGEMYYKYDKDEPQTDFSHPCYCCANNNICEFAFTDAVKICRYVYKPQAERSE